MWSYYRFKRTYAGTEVAFVLLNSEKKFEGKLLFSAPAFFFIEKGQKCQIAFDNSLKYLPVRTVAPLLK